MRFGLPFCVVAVIAAALAISASAFACATPSFLGDYPKDEELFWSENVQGVAHNDDYWFFTNQNSLLRLPADFALSDDPDFVNHSHGELIRKLETNFIDELLGIEDYPELAALGINHFGDIDYYRGFIFAPLEKPAVTIFGVELEPAQSFIAIFNTDLELLSYVETTGLQGPKAGWLAIDPWTGYLYSSPSHLPGEWDDDKPPEEQEPAELFRYQITIEQSGTETPVLSLALLPDRIRLTEADGSAWSHQLRHMQGGTFTPWGDLVILNGFIDDSSTTDRGGIHIFRPHGASRQATEFSLVEESVNETGLGGFRFAYDGVDDDEEPEGIDWWNRGPGSGPAEARGQLHGIMVDNTQLLNFETDPDDLYFKHYSVDYSCLPDFDGDGLATSAEVDEHGTDPLNADTDGDLLSDLIEVDVLGSDPLDADSDGDGIPDGNEDSDGDGLSNGAEVNTHGTNPLDADSDDDGFSDGFEIAHGTNPLSSDSDGDGIPDGRDVEVIQASVAALPTGAFKPPGGGTRQAMLDLLDDAETLIAKGRTTAALDKLTTLRARVDGCGVTAAKDDWITDCAAQLEIRALIDMLLANLRA